MSQPLRRSQRLKEKRKRQLDDLNDANNSINVKNRNQSNQNVRKKQKIPEKDAKKAAGKKASKVKKNSQQNSNNKNKKYWLMKSEPSAYSIDDLLDEGDAGDYWDGIRNYQVRNMIRDEIKCDDECIFYHSCCKPPGIAGSMIVTKECYADFTAFDRNEKYYDPKSDKNNPKWFMFNVKGTAKFEQFISLAQLKQIKGLETLKILQKGNRLSITAITKDEYHLICDIGNGHKQIDE
eukprot:CAMPEP_0201573034 /NCGR_PEP_ID=MMETSP0190_2-20130828/16674_1 /ASSEMBLY_ACC=CAM_ASM_000263 /TAXON_ID=37353 /ORGANISM="Rosalina sp." /LENGTH=235 /DNA_ID=CAMNT_0047999517 /DNA_START=29 /DNA_END=736 /DNA_ORIENTATION=-